MVVYRPFTTEKDYQAMKHIVSHNCLVNGTAYLQWHIGNLDFIRCFFSDEFTKIILMIELNQEIIGFIYQPKDGFVISILHEYEYLQKEIFIYIETHSYEKGTLLETEANSDNKKLCSLLKNLGYQKNDDYRYAGICDLSKINMQTPLPNGCYIDITKKTDIAKRVELFGLATGGAIIKDEQYIQLMNSNSYKNCLDLIVKNSKHEIITYCTTWYDPKSQVAVFEPIACIKEYRRKGITKSVLLYAMHKMKKRGCKIMYVGTSGTNIPSRALYKSVGFIEKGREYIYEKQI